MARAPSLVETRALYRDGQGAPGIGEFVQPRFLKWPIDPALAEE
jgi:hypothetical protein